jgi:hypothetical protein
MAKERLPALHVVALAKNPVSASQLASVRNATGLASAAVTFVAARAKSNHQSSNPARQLSRVSKFAAARRPNSGSLAMLTAMRREARRSIEATSPLS